MHFTHCFPSHYNEIQYDLHLLFSKHIIFSRQVGARWWKWDDSLEYFPHQEPARQEVITWINGARVKWTTKTQVMSCKSSKILMEKKNLWVSRFPRTNEKRILNWISFGPNTQNVCHKGCHFIMSTSHWGTRARAQPTRKIPVVSCQGYGTSPHEPIVAQFSIVVVVDVVVICCCFFCYLFSRSFPKTCATWVDTSSIYCPLGNDGRRSSTDEKIWFALLYAMCMPCGKTPRHFLLAHWTQCG